MVEGDHGKHLLFREQVNLEARQTPGHYTLHAGIAAQRVRDSVSLRVEPKKKESLHFPSGNLHVRLQYDGCARNPHPFALFTLLGAYRLFREKLMDVVVVAVSPVQPSTTRPIAA
jgi:hypothetical protein